jgi:hypothetical protein
VSICCETDAKSTVHNWLGLGNELDENRYYYGRQYDHYNYNNESFFLVSRPLVVPSNLELLVCSDSCTFCLFDVILDVVKKLAIQKYRQGSYSEQNISESENETRPEVLDGRLNATERLAYPWDSTRICISMKSWCKRTMLSSSFLISMFLDFRSASPFLSLRCSSGGNCIIIGEFSTKLSV